jgi:hypothetical protein
VWVTIKDIFAQSYRFLELTGKIGLQVFAELSNSLFIKASNKVDYFNVSFG